VPIQKNLGLVKPITVSESGSYMETAPAKTTLNIDRLKYVLGIMPPDVRWTIKWAFKNLRSSYFQPKNTTQKTLFHERD